MDILDDSRICRVVTCAESVRHDAREAAHHLLNVYFHLPAGHPHEALYRQTLDALSDDFGKRQAVAPVPSQS